MPSTHSIELLNSSSEGSLSKSSSEMFDQVKEQFLGCLLEDRFLIEEYIGRGSSSIVFAATDIKNLNKVAVKVLVKDIHSAGRRIDRFNQETRTTRYLRHRNILESFSYGIEKNHAYFAMEYLSGGSLQDLLDRKERLSEKKASRIIRQVAAALAFAHKEGVIHRDIKPSNILFQDKKQNLVKIVDFGMSTRLSWDYSDDVFRTPTGEIYGTTLYMSPEQSKGETSGQRTDIYSLGCVFYECLTGLPPHTGNTAVDVVIKHQTEPVIPVNQVLMSDAISIEVQTILDKMLRKKVKDRYQSFEMILKDFEDLDKCRFKYERYLKTPNNEPQTKKVNDYSNVVFVIALVIVAFICGLGLSLL